jgi:ornithine cyclodeaminase/alanine dehydrogenase-like protein (mu-crystallin family)
MPCYRLHRRHGARRPVHRRGRWFVDSIDTTLGHIGEFMMPLASGVITRGSVLGDLYALVQKAGGRRGDDEITVFKNGGGAHLDVMVSTALVKAYKAQVR